MERFKTFFSCKSQLKVGVPQGSILGPLLFIVYINDLPKVIHPMTCILYADDTNILIMGDTIDAVQVNLQNTITKLTEWLRINKLILNIEKTSLLNFHFPGKTSHSPVTMINSKTIGSVSSNKFLGVHISDDLTWNTHVEMVNKRLSSICFSIFRLRNCVTKDALLSVYFSKFQSLLSYGIMFWGSCSRAESTFRLQKKVLRTIFGQPPRASCKPLFKRYGILTMPCLFIFKCINYVIQNKEKYKINGSVHNYSTRQVNDIHTVVQHSSLFRNSVYQVHQFIQ